MKICLTGPESTGKSSLALNLAQHYKCARLDEIARTYLEAHGTDYDLEDVLRIGKMQANLIDSVSEDQGLIFLDTDLMVILIWLKDKFNLESTELELMFERQKSDLYLLCDIDLEWIDDGQREDPERRQYLFDQYVRFLESHNCNFKVVGGQNEVRIQNAIEAIGDIPF